MRIQAYVALAPEQAERIAVYLETRAKSTKGPRKLTIEQKHDIKLPPHVAERFRITESAS